MDLNWNFSFEIEQSEIFHPLDVKSVESCDESCFSRCRPHQIIFYFLHFFFLRVFLNLKKEKAKNKAKL